MSALSRDLAGTGAMLVRLIDVGRRSGLSAPATLLHVLDGVPLQPPCVELGDELQHRPVADADGSLTVETAGVVQMRLDDINEHTIRRPLGLPGSTTDASPLVLTFPVSGSATKLDAHLSNLRRRSAKAWEPAKGSKSDQALDLWSTTQLTQTEIAARTGSTAGAVRSVVKKAVARGNPRAVRPTVEADPEEAAAIALALNEPLKTEKIVSLYGSTGLPVHKIAEMAGSTPPAASFYLRNARLAADPRVAAGDERRGRALDSSHRQDAADQEASSATEGGDHEVASQNEFDPSGGSAGEPTVGVEPVDPRNSPEGADEAPMAVDGVGEVCATALPSQSDNILPAGDGEARRGQPEPDVSPEGATSTGVAPVPGETAPEGSHDAVTGGESAAVERETDQTSADQAAGEADVAHPPAPQDEPRPEMGTVSGESRSAVRPAGPGQDSEDGGSTTARILNTYGKTTISVREIAGQLGKSYNHVSGCVAAARSKKDPRVLAGDDARGKTALVVAPAPAAKPTPAPSAPAPTSANAQPGDLVELKHDQAVAIDRGWIVGPSGAVKGFPLINSILLALAGGELFDAGVVAKKSAVRSGEAVLMVVNQWSKDLAAIGIEVVRVGSADLRIRRLGGA